MEADILNPLLRHLERFHQEASDLELRIFLRVLWDPREDEVLAHGSALDVRMVSFSSRLVFFSWSTSAVMEERADRRESVML